MTENQWNRFYFGKLYNGIFVFEFCKMLIIATIWANINLIYY